MLKKITLICLLVSCNKFKLINKGYEQIEASSEALILSAIKDSNIKLLSIYLRNKDINILFNGKSLLHLAVESNNKEVINFLFTKKIDPLIRDNNNKFAHELSSSEEIKKDLKIYIKIIELEESIKNNNLKSIDILIKSNDLYSVLCLALKMNNEDLVKLLIDKDCHKKNENGYTLLMIASDQGHKEVADLLLNKGADVNDKTNTDWTALMIASSSGYKEVVNLLLNKGANVNDKDNDGWTSLILASQNGHKEVLELLLNKGANVNDKSISELTALYMASWNGHKEVVDLLLTKGANVNDKNNNEWTALIIASANGHKEVAELLLNKGANVNNKNNFSWTALYIASANGHKEVAELLLNRGADVNDKTNIGRTALMIASSSGHKELADLLLNRGADNDKYIDELMALILSSKSI